MSPLDAKPSGPDKNNAQGSLPTSLAVTVLLGLTLAFYHGLWLPGLMLIKRDAFRFFLPLKQYLVERLSAGELPQWFPYEALGRPFIGATATGIFHPFTALYFLFPVYDAYRASTLLSCLLAAGGAFVLGRRLEISPPGALLAGIAFAFSGYVVSSTDNLLYLYSICVLPLFCAGLEKALVGRRAWVVVPAAIWATVFLMGDVQTGYYYGFIALLWTAMRAPGSRREAALRLLLVGGLTAFLAGVQLGPAASVFVGSDRTQSALFHERAMHWSTHPLRLATVLASPIAENENLSLLGRLLYGPPGAGVWAESLYLGVPVIGLTLLGAWHGPKLRVLVLLGSFALLLALGRYVGFYEVFYHVVPLWSAFRYPEKLMGVVSFSAAILAGAGLDALRVGKGRPLLWFAGVGLCVGAGLSLYTARASAWMAASFGASPALAQELTDSGARAFLFSAVAALGVGIAVLGFQKGAMRLELLLTFLIAIVVLDLSRANLGAYHTAPAEAATFFPPLAEAIRAREGTLEPGRFRLISFYENEIVYPQHLRHWLDFYGGWSVERRQALDLVHHAQFHIEAVRGYLPGFRAPFIAMLERGIDPEGAARYNTAYFIGRWYRFKDPRFAKTLVAALPDFRLALFQNPVPAKPRVYLSQRPERAASPVDPVALLARPDFLSGEVDMIETPDPTLPEPASDGSTTIEHYAPENVQVRVDATKPVVLILLDAFDAGWTATLESGVELPILRANALVRAVVVPAGTHVVAFSYQTPLLKTGAWASLVGVLLSFWLIAHARWRTNHMGRFRSERKAHGV